jgi:DNA-binding MarR family transcriptional regulator
MTHPSAGLDEAVHQRIRLGILTITQEASRVEFGYLRESLGVTAGNLSKHLSVLSEAGLVAVDKGHQGNRPKTWVRITSAGRHALAEEIRNLKLLIQAAEAGQAT